MIKSKEKIAIIGLGYVGLPLAVEFSKKYETIGYDINKLRIDELISGYDSTLEVDETTLSQTRNLKYTSNEADIKGANIYIITVPTPIDANRQPDLTPLIEASKLIGRVINKDDIVIYESTVYPGATEDDCIPVIETTSGLKFNKDFFAGYSPERINPGDKERPVTKIMKVTSGSTPEIADYVDKLYSSIIEAGTFKAKSIKIAEASKIIENTQRDVNIALINELAMVFDLIGIDTSDVIEAAATKWNFIKLQPGLVGGHCISVDPYYLVHKSICAGHIPDMIRTAREINDGMPRFVAGKLIRGMIEKGQLIKGSNGLVLGLTFKENCPDLRNTKVLNLITEIQSYGTKIDVYDPLVEKSDREKLNSINLIDSLDNKKYDFIVLTVAHEKFRGIECVLSNIMNESCTVLDMKNFLNYKDADVIRI